MNIYGLSIPNFFVAILVGIILSVTITALMTPNYDHVDIKPIVAAQPTIQTTTHVPISDKQISDEELIEIQNNVAVAFHSASLGLVIFAAVILAAVILAAIFIIASMLFGMDRGGY